MKQLWIVAGPNGAGKTTLTRRYLVGRVSVINPDEFAAKLSNGSAWTPETALAAGRQALAV